MLIGVLVVYLLGTLVLGALLSTRIKRVSDYLVAGRSLGLALTTASLAAVQIGAGVVLGGAETGAASGLWPGVWYGLGCGGGLILGGLLAAEKMRSVGGVVPIDYFAVRYGEHRGVRTWAWLSNIPSLLGIFAAQLMAAGSVLSPALGVSFQTAVLIVASVIFLSNVLSGMWGVVFADFFQVSIITIGVPLTALAAIGQIDSAATMRVLSTPFIPDGMGSRAVFLITPFLFSISVSYDAFIRYQSARTGAIAKWACIAGGPAHDRGGVCGVAHWRRRSAGVSRGGAWQGVDPRRHGHAAADRRRRRGVGIARGRDVDRQCAAHLAGRLLLA